MNNSLRVKRWRKESKARIVKAMGGKCQCCGYNHCFAALELHHIDKAKKDFSFGSVRANPKNWEKIIVELKKCILVCANCHRELHNDKRELPVNFLSFDDKFEIYNKKLHTYCPVCNKEKPKLNKFCSTHCFGISKQKINWSETNLEALIKDNKNLTQIGKSLGISDNAIRKRLKKLNLLK